MTFPLSMRLILIPILLNVGVMFLSGDDIDGIVNAHAARVTRALEQYDREVAQSSRIAMGQLEPLAKAATRKGRIADANKVWLEILRLDLTNQEARSHFESLGMLDNALKEIGSSSTGRYLLEAKLADSQWKWPYKTSFFYFTLKPDGSLLLYDSPKATKPLRTGEWKIISPQAIQVYTSNTYTMVFNPNATRFTCHAGKGNGHDGLIGERLR